MRWPNFLWWVPSSAGTAAMAWKVGWLAALLFLVVTAGLSWIAWEVRRTKGAGALVKDELIPTLDAVNDGRTRWMKGRAERKKLKVRTQHEIRKLENRYRDSDKES